MAECDASTNFEHVYRRLQDRIGKIYDHRFYRYSKDRSSPRLPDRYPQEATEHHIRSTEELQDDDQLKFLRCAVVLCSIDRAYRDYLLLRELPSPDVIRQSILDVKAPNLTPPELNGLLNYIKSRHKRPLKIQNPSDLPEIMALKEWGCVSVTKRSIGDLYEVKFVKDLPKKKE
jgi:hypothetical protein